MDSPMLGPPKPTFRERFHETKRWVSSRYGVADPRTLGLARLVVGWLLCADLIRHWAAASRYYSNQGVLPNHELLAHPSSEFNFSLFNAFAAPSEVHVAFACALFCHACFALGWHARIFSVLSCVWVTSLDQRLVLVENGGYVVVNLLTLWLAFLPTGTRFSIDAWRRAQRECRPRSVAELAATPRATWETKPHRSLAALIVVLNLGVIYVFNVVNKYGETWRVGASVHYVLHLDRMVTGLAVPLREHLPYRLLQAASWLTLMVEALIAVAILWPTQRRLARPFAMGLMVALHTGLGLIFRLGPFSWFMIGWSTLLLQRTHWESLEAWYRRRMDGVVVTLSPELPYALRLGLGLQRLDAMHALAFEAGSQGGPIFSVRRDGQVLTGAPAYRLALRALPFGFALAPLGNLLAVAEARSASITRFFGWTRAASPKAGRPPTLPRALGRALVATREGCLLFLLLCSASALVRDNKSIPAALHFKQPGLVRATIGYLRIFQGWGMFAPNPVREDGVVAVEGYTIDGRRVDPFTGREPDLDLTDARGLGLGQIEQDYFNRIRLDRNRVYHKALSDYLQAWHTRTGRPEDELIAFDVHWLRDQCPEPRALVPTEHETICLLSWRKPNFRPKPGMPVPPMRCKQASADKKD